MKSQSLLEVDLFVSIQELTAWSTSVPAILCHGERNTGMCTYQFASLKNALSFWVAPNLLASMFYNSFKFQTFTDNLAIRKAVTFQRQCSLTARDSLLICFKTQGEKQLEKRGCHPKMKAYGRVIFLPKRQLYFPLIVEEGDPFFELCSEGSSPSTVQAVQEHATYWWLSLQASGKALLSQPKPGQGKWKNKGWLELRVLTP